MRFAHWALRHWHELLGVAVVLWFHLQARNHLRKLDSARRSATLRYAIDALAVLVSAWAVFALWAQLPQGYRQLPGSWWAYWLRGGGLAWCFGVASAGTALWLWRRMHRLSPKFSERRRGFVRLAGSALAGAPFAVLGYGVFVQRSAFRLREVDIRIPGLAPDLNGLRLVQISDIHLSPFLTERELAYCVDMANETRSHVALVTGDLITATGDPLDACIKQLSRLKADAGVLGCLGNHEIYAEVEEETTCRGARIGIDFLRQRARLLRFGSAALNFVGVDFQRMANRYLAGTEKMIVPGATNILLSHNPDVFDVAARKGFDLTVAGHTHGGQVTVEILHQTVNAARFFTPYVYGLYRKGPASIWVTRGIGTVGIPARLGAPPEITVLRLCAT